MGLLNQIDDSARVSNGRHAGIQGFFQAPFCCDWGQDRTNISLAFISCYLGTGVPLTKYSAVY